MSNTYDVGCANSIFKIRNLEYGMVQKSGIFRNMYVILRKKSGISKFSGIELQKKEEYLFFFK
jgi:hypothetical protein